MTPEHYPEVMSIYQEGIERGNAIFEKDPRSKK
jgi:L-amino acid N-acyltransferase YncA